MMPDRYDELRKRRLIQLADNQEIGLQMDDINVEGDAPAPIETPIDMPIIEQQEVKPARSPSSENSYAQYGDLIAGVGPSALALLGGASPAVINMQLDKGNAYAKTRGGQEMITKDKIAVVEDDNGEPLNIDVRDAIGRKPYYQQKLAGINKADPSNLQSVQRVYDPTSGKTILKGITRGGQVVDLEQEASLGVGAATGTDMYGTKTTTQYSRNEPNKQKLVKSTPGFGAAVGVPEKTIKAVDKVTDKYAKDTDILEVKKNELNNAVNIFTKKGATPTELTSAREALIRAITTETRLTDSDVERAMGDDFREIKDKALAILGNKAFGEMDPEQKRDFLTSAKTLIKRLDNALLFAYDKSKQRASAIPGGKKYFESQTPKRTKTSELRDADVKKLEKDAAARYGEGTERYYKFLDFQRARMGM